MLIFRTGISIGRQGDPSFTLIEPADLICCCRPDALPFTLETLRPEGAGLCFPDAAAVEADQYATLISVGGCSCCLLIGMLISPIRLFFC